MGEDDFLRAADADATATATAPVAAPVAPVPLPDYLADLDDTYRCLICAQYFDKAVTVTKCGHSFCSLCIRSFWILATESGSGQQRQPIKFCPTCKQEIGEHITIEKEIIASRTIQEGLLGYYKVLQSMHIDYQENDKSNRNKKKQNNHREDEAPIATPLPSMNYSTMNQ